MRRFFVWFSFVFLVSTLSLPAYAQENSACDEADEIAEIARIARESLTDTPVSYSETSYSYRRVLRHLDGSTYTDPPRGEEPYSGYAWMEIPHVVLNLDTCETRRVTITRKIEKGREVLAEKEPDFSFAVEGRVYGTPWNFAYTPIVVTPPNWVVVANKWKDFKESTYVIQTPFSTPSYNATKSLAQKGQTHIDADRDFAFEELRSLGVPSRARAGELAADVVSPFSEDIGLLPRIEHTDPTEFYAFLAGKTAYNPFERAAWRVGMHGDLAYDGIQSKARAIGIVQIWYRTCRDLRVAYLEALIPRDCTAAPGDPLHRGHIESLKSAILHYDYRLADFVRELDLKYNPKTTLYSLPTGEVISNNELRRMLMAAYNGGPGGWHKRYGKTEGTGISYEIYVHRILRDHPEKRWDSYTDHAKNSVKPETISYLDKYDWLLEHGHELGIVPHE